MVERPIKKSDRQTAEPSNAVKEVEVVETEPDAVEGSVASITQAPEERNIPKPVRNLDKTKGKEGIVGREGKGKRDQRDQQEDSRSKLVSPALMRGPKPTKPKPPVIKDTESEITEESVTEDDQDPAVES